MTSVIGSKLIATSLSGCSNSWRQLCAIPFRASASRNLFGSCSKVAGRDASHKRQAGLPRQRRPDRFPAGPLSLLTGPTDQEREVGFRRINVQIARRPSARSRSGRRQHAETRDAAGPGYSSARRTASLRERFSSIQGLHSAMVGPFGPRTRRSLGSRQNSSISGVSARCPTTPTFPGRRTCR